MKKKGTSYSLIVALLACLPAASLAGDVDWSPWSLFAPIDMPAIWWKPVAECALTPEVLDASLPGLQDVRVVALGLQEIGYTVHTDRGSTQDLPLPLKLYNRTFVPDRESAVTVDCGLKKLKNRIQVDTPGTNFRRRVLLEGSDDGVTWKTVRERAWLFRVSRPDGTSSAYDGNVVTFSNNDFRYLRITVFNGEDDKGALEITDVKAFQRVKTPAETVVVPVVSSRTEEKNNITYLSLDLGYRHLPLYELKLDFSDANFFRDVSVWGRNREIRVVRRVVEDSPAHEKTVEEPWTHILSGNIHRFSADRATEESVTLNLQGAPYRYIQVRIQNRDDAPLQVAGVSATRLVQRLVFSTKREWKYDLMTGYPEAEKRVYDIGHYIAKLRSQGVIEARLGQLLPNRAHKNSEKVVPWSERHKEILWIALLTMALALGILVYRMAVSVRKQG